MHTHPAVTERYGMVRNRDTLAFYHLDGSTSSSYAQCDSDSAVPLGLFV